MSRKRRLWATTPAKVNLGLEVVGRRPDGYHELVTILQTVSLYDAFEWKATGEPFEYVGPSGVPAESDLVRRALDSAPDRDGWTGRLRAIKRIPVAAGMGGGSAGAALALRLAFPDDSDDALEARAVALGADVPFFIRGGTALATGTGATLAPIVTPRLWLVLLSPPLDLPEKTPQLYRGLQPGDFTDGANVRDITERIGRGEPLPQTLPNAFARQLLEYPVVRYACDRLVKAGASVVAVSGAGPTLFTPVASYREAVGIAERLVATGPSISAAHVVRAVACRDRRAAIAALAAAIRG
jgi:4-diphosphocytidyl-2-C-methyl-D-erythritol kinase